MKGGPGCGLRAGGNRRIISALWDGSGATVSPPDPPHLWCSHRPSALDGRGERGPAEVRVFMREVEGATRMGCLRCPVGDCPARAGEGGGDLRGWGLALGAAALFLCPLVLAIAGAIWCGLSEGWRLAGGVGGLALGMAASVALARVFWGGEREGAR